MSCLNLLYKELVADEGFEPPAQFCQAPAYETGEIDHFSNPLCLCRRRDSNPLILLNGNQICDHSHLFCISVVLHNSAEDQFYINLKFTTLFK